MDNNYVQPSPNFDLLVDLPVDKNQPTHNELKIINSIFPVVKETPKSSIKLTLIQYLCLTFLIMAFYYVSNDSIKQFLPTFLNKYEMPPVFIKALCVSIIYYVLQKYIIKI